MAVDFSRIRRKTWQTLSSIRTGIILLILVIISSAIGTVVLQRPITDPEDVQRAYSPQVLRWLDAIGLTDVFHAWWFVVLLLLVSVSIVCASIDRFPNAWRFFARPYRVPDQHFRAVLPLQKTIPVDSAEAGLAAAERVWRTSGYHPERIVDHDQVSLYAERHRFSVMAVYIVHASLLLIFLGGIADGLWGFKGFMPLLRGEQSSEISVPQGGKRQLPFAIRCDSAGQENYPDGTPKRWWSNLTVLENGREVLKKEIAVNDPLTYRGVRFFQASYGSTGGLDSVELLAAPVNGQGEKKVITLNAEGAVQLDADTSVRVAEFIPDAVVRDGQVIMRSRTPENPALHLLVEQKKAGKSINVWLPPISGVDQNSESPYMFEGRDLHLAYFTGLQVAHEPGQWLVWAGCVLMALGLGTAFYLSHKRLWAVPVRLEDGRIVLWVGGATNKNREDFAERFHALSEKIQKELQPSSSSTAAAEEEVETVAS